jgi:cell division protein FtsX
LLFKAIILKYGGAKGYRLLRPFFLGMVLGAFGAAGLWLIIDAFGGMSNWFTM